MDKTDLIIAIIEKRLPKSNNYFNEIKKIWGNNYVRIESIFLLASEIEKKDKKIIFKEKDKHGALDKCFRLKATGKLIEEGKELKKVYLVGGCNKELRKFRTEAMKEYLEENKSDNNSEEVEIEELRCCPGNTCGNIIEVIKKVKKTRKKSGIISNLYHLPRVKALTNMMIKNQANKNDEISLDKFRFIPAEKIIEEEEMRSIKNFYNSDSMKDRIHNEIIGFNQASQKRYKCEWPLSFKK